MPTSHTNGYLPILAGIQPAVLRQLGAILSVAYHSMMINPDHLLHHLMVRPTTAPGERMRSRHPFVFAAQKLVSELSDFGIYAAQLMIYGMQSTLRPYQSFTSY